jgi:type IV pilus assembly protein PilC
MSTSYEMQREEPRRRTAARMAGSRPSPGGLPASMSALPTALGATGGDESLDAEEGLPLWARRIRKSELLYVTNQLSVMVSTGVTLSTALSAIADQEENPSLRRVLKDLRRSVEAGEDFSTALARYPKLFDKTYVSLVRASEATGMLGEMLERIAHYLGKNLETRGKVRAAMMYPSVMLVMAVGVTIFLLTFVMPKFTPIFESRAAGLPKPTKVLMALSNALVDYWYLWVLGALAVAAGLIYAVRTPAGRRVWDGLKLQLPIVGPAIRKVVLGRSVRTLGAMVRGGVPMLDALQLSADVAGNVHYEDVWRHVVHEVTQGKQIHAALAGNRLFPATLVQMIASGEETGKLDVVLERVSDYYDREVEQSLKTATSLIEPLMIAVMGVVIGGIGMSIMLPIFTLSRPT